MIWAISLIPPFLNISFIFYSISLIIMPTHFFAGQAWLLYHNCANVTGEQKFLLQHLVVMVVSWRHKRNSLQHCFLIQQFSATVCFTSWKIQKLFVGWWWALWWHSKILPIGLVMKMTHLCPHLSQTCPFFLIRVTAFLSPLLKRHLAWWK